MKINETKPAMDDLRDAYGAALVVFNSASAALILDFAAESIPSDELIATEEKARAAVVDARRKLWTAAKLKAKSNADVRPERPETDP
jgi:hypothetical protein